MNYNKEILKQIMDLECNYGIDLNYILKEMGIKSPEEERLELLRSRKDKIKNIFGDEI